MQEHYGGGETYTASVVRAIQQLGLPQALIHHPKATFWPRILGDGVATYAMSEAREITALLSSPPLIKQVRSRKHVLVHTRQPATAVETWKTQGWVTHALIHMPQQGRSVEGLASYDQVHGVSHYVIRTLLAHGLQNVSLEPMYGLASLPVVHQAEGHQTTTQGATPSQITPHSPYQWDTRKWRDRLYAQVEKIYPLYRHWQRAEQAAAPIRLGLVSRLTPIKQFPLLFQSLAPILQDHPTIGLDIYGSGGYASVRDLRQALQPIAHRTRWFGFQSNPALAYQNIDYLLTGLPEKEALGLNVLEAASIGVPCLAIQAEPFTETVQQDVTGLFYQDPRVDGGASFAALLNKLQTQPFRADTAHATTWLQKFDLASFTQRWQHALSHE